MIDTEARVPVWWTAAPMKRRAAYLARHPEITERRQRIASLAALASTIRPEWAAWPMDQRREVAARMVAEGATMAAVREATGLSERAVRVLRAAAIPARTATDPVTWREVIGWVEDGLGAAEIAELMPGARRDKIGFAVTRARKQLIINAADSAACHCCGRKEPVVVFTARKDKPGVKSLWCDPCRELEKSRQRRKPRRRQTREPGADPSGRTRWCSRCKGMRATEAFGVTRAGAPAKTCTRCLAAQQARREAQRPQG